jgi:signal transduction histidine kinase
LLFGAVPCLLLAFASAWWFIERAFAPLRKLTSAVENIHAGNLKQQLPSNGSGDEIDRLTRVFNAMTGRLDDAFQRVREFTLHASHELKTPLTVIRGELETALNLPGASTDERDRAASLLDEVERLAQIVDGLTFLTKADAGQLKLARQAVRLDDLVREACADAQVLAVNTNLRVELGQCDASTILADRHRIRQLLLILTDNAVKYNREGGTVFLAVARYAEKIELRVSNTGPGIATGELNCVFDRFYRGGHAQEQHKDGCGLGLCIAKCIAHAHDAQIEVTSRPESVTTVAVRFLAAPDHEVTTTPELVAA